MQPQLDNHEPSPNPVVPKLVCTLDHLRILKNIQTSEVIISGSETQALIFFEAPLVNPVNKLRDQCPNSSLVAIPGERKIPDLLRLIRYCLLTSINT